MFIIIGDVYCGCRDGFKGDGYLNGGGGGNKQRGKIVENYGGSSETYTTGKPAAGEKDVMPYIYWTAKTGSGPAAGGIDVQYIYNNKLWDHSDTLLVSQPTGRPTLEGAQLYPTYDNNIKLIGQGPHANWKFLKIPSDRSAPSWTDTTTVAAYRPNIKEFMVANPPSNTLTYGKFHVYKFAAKYKDKTNPIMMTEQTYGYFNAADNNTNTNTIDITWANANATDVVKYKFCHAVTDGANDSAPTMIFLIFTVKVGNAPAKEYYFEQTIQAPLRKNETVLATLLDKTAAMDAPNNTASKNIKYAPKENYSADVDYTKILDVIIKQGTDNINVHFIK